VRSEWRRRCIHVGGKSLSITRSVKKKKGASFGCVWQQPQRQRSRSSSPCVLSFRYAQVRDEFANRPDPILSATKPAEPNPTWRPIPGAQCKPDPRLVLASLKDIVGSKHEYLARHELLGLHKWTSWISRSACGHGRFPPDEKVANTRVKGG